MRGLRRRGIAAPALVDRVRVSRPVATPCPASRLLRRAPRPPRSPRRRARPLGGIGTAPAGPPFGLWPARAPPPPSCRAQPAFRRSLHARQAAGDARTRLPGIASKRPARQSARVSGTLATAQHRPRISLNRDAHSLSRASDTSSRIDKSSAERATPPAPFSSLDVTESMPSLALGSSRGGGGAKTRTFPRRGRPVRNMPCRGDGGSTGRGRPRGSTPRPDAPRIPRVILWRPWPRGTP